MLGRTDDNNVFDQDVLHPARDLWSDWDAAPREVGIPAHLSEEKEEGERGEKREWRKNAEKEEKE